LQCRFPIYNLKKSRKCEQSKRFFNKSKEKAAGNMSPLVEKRRPLRVYRFQRRLCHYTFAQSAPRAVSATHRAAKAK